MIEGSKKSKKFVASALDKHTQRVYLNNQGEAIGPNLRRRDR